MFCRRHEKKRCHPCVTLMLCAFTAVGVAAVMNKGKCMIKQKIKNLMGFVKGGCKCTVPTDEQN